MRFGISEMQKKRKASKFLLKKNKASGLLSNFNKLIPFILHQYQTGAVADIPIYQYRTISLLLLQE